MFVEGDFSFWNDTHSKNMVESAWKTLNTNHIQFLSKYKPNKEQGFLWTPEDDKPEILKEIEHNINISYADHSGFSFAWTMRILQRISTNGWDNFVKEIQSMND